MAVEKTETKETLEVPPSTAGCVISLEGIQVVAKNCDEAIKVLKEAKKLDD